MTIWEKLAGILKLNIDFSRLKDIHILSDNRVTFNHNITNNNTTININLSASTSEEVRQLKPILKELLNEGTLFIKDDSKRLLDDVSTYSRQGTDHNILEFFKGKISSQDLEMLRASLYIRHVYKNGTQVIDLRHDLIKRYGQRGINISNLCSAGYFESLIKPMYEEMSSKENFNDEKFRQQFDVIVMQYSFAVFVGATRTKDDIKSEIIRKIGLNKRYGIRNLTIHGLGHYNVERINELLNEIKDQYVSISNLDSAKGYINVQITF